MTCASMHWSRISTVCTFDSDNPILNGLPQKYRTRIISSISTDLPFEKAIFLIPDDSYWERKSKLAFKLANVREYGSWKRLYCEKLACSLIESFEPTFDDFLMSERLSEFRKTLLACAEHVQRLEVKNLKALDIDVSIPAKSQDLASKEDLTKLMKELSPDHLDIGIVISTLDNLKHLSLYYGY